MYPTGSRPGQFYRLAKMHKLKDGERVNELPFRPIVSNIGTASYEIAKHLVQLLSPLVKSEFTVSSTNKLLNILEKQVVPEDCELLPFDVTSLFTNVSLKFTIDVILGKVYDEKMIHTNIPRKELKELLLLCTKNVHFGFNNKLYQQLDEVAMGSLLGPVIAGIFMVEFKTTIVLTLSHYLSLYVLSKRDIVVLFWR